MTRLRLALFVALVALASACTAAPAPTASSAAATPGLPTGPTQTAAAPTAVSTPNAPTAAATTAASPTAAPSPTTAASQTPASSPTPGPTPAPTPAATPTESLAPSPTIPTSTNLVEVAAGGGTADPSAGGNATDAHIQRPTGVAVAGNGIIGIVDSNAGTVLAVGPDGLITTAATGLTGPQGMCLTFEGTAFVADRGANRVVTITSDGGVKASRGQ